MAGVVTVGLGLAAIVIALVEGKAWGWASAATLGVFALGVALLVAFWFIEHRVRWPIVEFDLFRNGPYFGASAAGFCLVGCYWALMFLQPQYLQTDLGHGALDGRRPDPADDGADDRDLAAGRTPDRARSASARS